jgi:hypothetical protein
MTVSTKSANTTHAHASNHAQSAGRFSGLQQRGLSHQEAKMVKSTLSSLKTQMAQLQKLLKGDGFQKQSGAHAPVGFGKHSCHPAPPKRQDASHPAGSLKTDANGTITTPGGYKIEATGQFDWKITGPDGKETKVWGDPHVAEGDGGKWDFKRDSTFVLGDGTRINASTVPFGKDATVTGSLEIISGNDRVQVTDIDKGKGKTGPVTADGFAHANSFGGKDVFVMGKESDDWSFQGREIVGSENLGETFKLGNPLEAGGQGNGGLQGVKAQATSPKATQGKMANPQNAYLQQLNKLFSSMASLFSSMSSFGGALSQRTGQNPFCGSGGKDDWMANRQNQLGSNFEDIGRMLDVFARMDALNRGIQSMRGMSMA